MRCASRVELLLRRYAAVLTNQVYRKKWVIHVERVHVEKSNAATVPVHQPQGEWRWFVFASFRRVADPLQLDKDRRAILERKGSKSETQAAKKESGDVEMVE
jgi:large subunit ribosomal protein L26e